MARHKIAKPKDRKYELAKKRERIRKTADYVYLFFIFLGIAICGANQFNNVIVGWGLIVMGIISVPAMIFHIYIDINKWEPLFWYDNPEFKSYISEKQREEDLSVNRFLRALETVALILFSTGLPILGILRLLGII